MKAKHEGGIYYARRETTPQSVQIGQKSAAHNVSQKMVSRRSYKHLENYDYKYYFSPQRYRSWKQGSMVVLLISGFFVAIIVFNGTWFADLYGLVLAIVSSFLAWILYVITKKCLEDYNSKDVLLAVGEEAIWVADFPAYFLQGSHNILWGDILTLKMEKPSQQQDYAHLKIRTRSPILRRSGYKWSEWLRLKVEGSPLPKNVKILVVKAIKTLPSYDHRKLLVILPRNEYEAIENVLMRYRSLYAIGST